MTMLTFFRRILTGIRPRRLHRIRLDAQGHGRSSMSAEATQSIVAHESVVAVVKQEDQTTAYRFSDSEGNAVVADLREDSVDLDLAGRSKSGEEGTMEVCRTLIERLRRDGQEWSNPVDMRIWGHCLTSYIFPVRLLLLWLDSCDWNMRGPSIM